MIRLGLRPNSSGGMREPRRLVEPLPGIKDPFLLPAGVTSLITSIFGASGALISGNFGCNDESSFHICFDGESARVNATINIQTGGEREKEKGSFNFAQSDKCL